MACEGMVTGQIAWDEASEEVDVAVRLAVRVLGDCERVMSYLEEAREHAEDLLSRHWHAVDHLAQQLMAERSLSGREVRRLLGTVIG
jgi:hypothetical protein